MYNICIFNADFRFVSVQTNFPKYLILNMGKEIHLKKYRFFVMVLLIIPDMDSGNQL